MAFTGMELPGIMCPDESIEQFARLYGSDHFGKMIISIGNPYGRNGNPQISLPQSPGLKDGQTDGYYSNVNCPAQVTDRNHKMNPQYGAQAFQGSRAMKHGGYGDPYNPSPSFENRRPEYFSRSAQQGGGSGYSSAFQGSRAAKHGGNGDQYNRSSSMEQRQSEYFSGCAQQGGGSGYSSAFQGSRAAKHGGNGDQYNRSPAMVQRQPEYFSRYAQQGVNAQQARPYQAPNHQNQYICPPPPGPRFPWL